MVVLPTQQYFHTRYRSTDSATPYLTVTSANGPQVFAVAGGHLHPFAAGVDD